MTISWNIYSRELSIDSATISKGNNFELFNEIINNYNILSIYNVITVKPGIVSSFYRIQNLSYPPPLHKTSTNCKTFVVSPYHFLKKSQKLSILYCIPRSLNLKNIYKYLEKIFIKI